MKRQDITTTFTEEPMTEYQQQLRVVEVQLQQSNSVAQHAGNAEFHSLSNRIIQEFRELK